MGDAQTPMRVNWVINAVNVALNYLLIFGGLGVPAMGVSGAALATCLAHGGSLILYNRVLAVRHAKVPEYGIRPLAEGGRRGAGRGRPPAGRSSYLPRL